MIFTLAGHVDHGKSSLVRALTGAETDRRAEEKRRGLTIDLGFAYADLGDRRVGFVDVPGHHRFVHNMVAGVAAGQTALIAVAADDGVMPQTREHVTILDLTGVERAVVAITKCDRVDARRREEVERDVAALLEPTRLIPIAFVHTSTSDPGSLARLRGVLSAAADAAQVDPGGAFRLAVDRAFNVRGVGLVVTGTVHSGAIETGAEVRIAPAGAPARVRNVRAQDRDARRAAAGDRCALNLTGIDTSDVQRGHWVVAEAAFAPRSSLVLNLTVARDFPRPARHGLTVHVYHATSHTEGRLSLLDGRSIAPGEQALAEIRLDEPLNPKRGDRIVLRDHGLDATLGGGPVVDTTPAARGRRSAARRERLLVLSAAPTAAAAMAALLALGEVDLESFRESWNLSVAESEALVSGLDVVRRTRGRRVWLEAAARWQGWRDHLLAKVDSEHGTNPDAPGLRREALAGDTALPTRWRDVLIRELVAEGVIEEAGGALRRPGHRPMLNDADARLLERVERALSEGGAVPSIGDMAKAIGIDLARLKGFVQRMHAQRRLVRVSESRVFLPAQIARFARVAHELAAHRPEGFSAREFRDASGAGRNLVIEVLEHFDARGFTRRSGDLRRVIGADPL